MATLKSKAPKGKGVTALPPHKGCPNCGLLFGRHKFSCLFYKGKTTKAPMFTEGEAKIIHSAILTTWNQIAPDAERACEGKNEYAIEVCIDADRLTFNCGYGAQGIQEGKDAAAFITAAIRVNPYAKVLKELSKMVSLV